MKTIGNFWSLVSPWVPPHCTWRHPCHPCIFKDSKLNCNRNLAIGNRGILQLKKWGRRWRALAISDHLDELRLIEASATLATPHAAIPPSCQVTTCCHRKVLHTNPSLEIPIPTHPSTYSTTLLYQFEMAVVVTKPDFFLLIYPKWQAIKTLLCALNSINGNLNLVLGFQFLVNLTVS